MPRTTVTRLEELGSHSNWERTRRQSSDGKWAQCRPGPKGQGRSDQFASGQHGNPFCARAPLSFCRSVGDARTPVRKEFLCRERQSSRNSAQGFRAAGFGFRSVRMRSYPLPRGERAGARDRRSCPTRNPRDESGVGRRTTVSGTGLEGNNWGDIRMT